MILHFLRIGIHESDWPAQRLREDSRHQCHTPSTRWSSRHSSGPRSPLDWLHSLILCFTHLRTRLCFVLTDRMIQSFGMLGEGSCASSSSFDLQRHLAGSQNEAFFVPLQLWLLMSLTFLLPCECCPFLVFFFLLLKAILDKRQIESCRSYKSCLVWLFVSQGGPYAIFLHLLIDFLSPHLSRHWSSKACVINTPCVSCVH